MSNMAWSEQELANAAKRVAESMLTSFPSPSECEHVFSDDFEHSMSTTAQEYSEVVKVDINGIPADLYIGNETSPEKALIWVDEANQVVFNIQGNISNEDIVHIAQSLILSIPTK